MKISRKKQTHIKKRNITKKYRKHQKSICKKSNKGGGKRPKKRPEIKTRKPKTDLIKEFMDENFFVYINFKNIIIKPKNDEEFKKNEEKLKENEEKLEENEEILKQEILKFLINNYTFVKIVSNEILMIINNIDYIKIQKNEISIIESIGFLLDNILSYIDIKKTYINTFFKSFYINGINTTIYNDIKILFLETIQKYINELCDNYKSVNKQVIITDKKDTLLMINEKLSNLKCGEEDEECKEEELKNFVSDNDKKICNIDKNEIIS